MPLLVVSRQANHSDFTSETYADAQASLGIDPQQSTTPPSPIRAYSLRDNGYLASFPPSPEPQFHTPAPPGFDQYDIAAFLSHE